MSCDDRRMRLDHLVLWVDDPLRSLAFFVDVVGLTAVREEEFRAGQSPYVSVRIDEGTIIDLMPRTFAVRVNEIPGAAGTAPRAKPADGGAVTRVR